MFLDKMRKSMNFVKIVIESWSTQGEKTVLLGERGQIFHPSLGIFSVTCPFHSLLQSLKKLYMYYIPFGKLRSGVSSLISTMSGFLTYSTASVNIINHN